MGLKQIRPKCEIYGMIDRGASLTIPVQIRDEFENPMNLNGFDISFTVKKAKFDFDMEDSRCYIKKDFTPQLPELGKFFVQLSSEDTNFEPDHYCFDIELVNSTDGAVFRICNLEFDLVGGPTNRTINPGLGQLPAGSEITIIATALGRPIVVVTPVISDRTINDRIALLESINIDFEDRISKLEKELADLTVIASLTAKKLNSISPILSPSKVSKETIEIYRRLVNLDL